MMTRDEKCLFMYRGKLCKDMSREELIDALYEMYGAYMDAMKNNAKEREMLFELMDYQR